MNILALVAVPSSQQGGMEWSTLEVCRGLAENGHEIDLVYKEDGDFLPLYRSFCASVTKARFHQEYIKNPVHDALSVAKGLLPVLKLDPDVVYIQKYQNSFFGALVARLKNVPLVCHLRAFPPKYAFNRQWSFGLKTITRGIAVSEATKMAYVRAGFSPDTIRVVYNGIDLNRYASERSCTAIRAKTRETLSIPPNTFVILYAGRVDPPKNIEMLIRGFAQLNLSASQRRLIVVGGPVNHETPEAGAQYVNRLKQLCSDMGIADQVHFLGKRQDLPALYSAADVTVLPSLLPDTFGRTLAESMACGTPAAGLRYGGIPEVLSDEFAKFQFDVGDVAGLTRILQSLNGWQLSDPTLGDRCRAYARHHFDADRAVVEVEAVLAEAIRVGPKRLGPTSKDLKKWGKQVSSDPDSFSGLTAW